MTSGQPDQIRTRSRRSVLGAVVATAVLVVTGASAFAAPTVAAGYGPAAGVPTGAPLSVGSRVVGGVPVGPATYPWMVRLSVGCGGALIAPRVVLTAGHCVTHAGPTTGIRVTGGDADLSSPAAVTTSSTYVLRAAGFVDATRGDDWALVQLAHPFNLPTLALTPDAGYDHGQFRVLGWGATRENGAQQRVLRTAVVPFVPDGTCRKVYAGNTFVNSQMICAGNLAHGGVDTCQGDSGGPMVRRDATGGWVEIGIVSWGYGCARAGYPGVYTQVSSFAKAITAAAATLS